MDSAMITKIAIDAAYCALVAASGRLLFGCLPERMRRSGLARSATAGMVAGAILGIAVQSYGQCRAQVAACAAVAGVSAPLPSKADKDAKDMTRMGKLMADLSLKQPSHRRLEALRQSTYVCFSAKGQAKDVAHRKTAVIFKIALLAEQGTPDERAMARAAIARAKGTESDPEVAAQAVHTYLVGRKVMWSAPKGTPVRQMGA